MRNILKVYLLFLICLSTGHAQVHHPQQFLQKIKGTPNEGQQIYQHYCANCHAQKPLISIGAPRIEEKADWKIRLQQDLDLLFKHTDEGLNAMPPRGGCFECTDYQLLLSIVALVPKDDKKEVFNKLKAHFKSS